MAIVLNRATPDVAPDASYDGPNRSNAGNPNGLLTPLFSGEIVLDTTGNVLWRAETMANNSWTSVTNIISAAH